MQDRIITLATDSLHTMSQLAEFHASSIEQLASTLISALMQDQRIFCCGNGASAGNVHSFVSKLGNRYERERPALPVILLGDAATTTAIAADGCFQDVFARPLQALARPGDVLLIPSASGNATNIVQAARAMQELGGRVLALTGEGGGELGRLLRSDQDVHLRLPGNSAPRVHEAQLFVLNCCCDLIDREFFGANDV
ncbi:MAG: SIS domain-containing protein [Pedobacter sp.]|nr:SIS domain-containing protein [Pedobacter sp.]